MRCAVCRHGQTEPGEVTFSIDRGGTVVVVRNVPASICGVCGEEYVDAEVMKELEIVVARAQDAGLSVAVRPFKAA